QDLCGWIQGENTTIDWFRERSSENEQVDIIGPMADHTFGNSSGYYAITKLKFPVSNFENIQNSVLISPQLPHDIAGPMCAEWWYMMYRSDNTQFSVYLIVDNDLNEREVSWRRRGDHGHHWQYDQLQIEPVSIDDLKLLDGPCIKPNFIAIGCTFEEEHICGYSSDPTGNFAWTRIRGSRHTLLTGPSEDHTLGTDDGHFMLVKATYPQKPGDKARLISGIESGDQGRCLEFWYHQYGSDIGKLNVYIDTNTTGNGSYTLLWSHGANIGDIWRKAHIATEYTTPFRIIFEGIIGNGIKGDIAIDDIRRLPQSCKDSNNCDFEDDTFCGWENVKKTDDFDWQLTRGQSSAELITGPLVDHTLGTTSGVYAFIDSRTNGKGNQTAMLISQSMPGTGSNGMCLEFFYHMYGAGIGSLTIYLQQEGFRRIPIWTLSGEQINDWLQGKVGFVVNSDHSILIEATIAKGNESDIAIDDISIVNGYCTIYPILAQPNTSFTISTQRTTTTTLGVTTSLISSSITNTSSNPLSTPITTSRSTTNTWPPSSVSTPKTTLFTMLSSELPASMITPQLTVTTISTSPLSTLGNFAIVIVISLLSVL
ncbi:unnamed protein product, partial [Rotaria sp. Silwood1]